MSPSTRLAHLRPLALTALSIVVALALGACDVGSDPDSAGSPTPSTSRTPVPKGAISKVAAQQVVDHFQAVNNAANAARDAKLLGTVEAGVPYAQDQGAYKQWKTWTAKKQKTYSSPFAYENRQYIIPAAPATWFAVTATSSDGDKSRGMFVFDKADGGPYKMSGAIWLGKKTTLPKIAVDRHGLAESVDPAQQVGALAPSQLRTAYEDLWETGGAQEGKKLASTAETEEAISSYRRYKAHGTGKDDQTGKNIADSWFVTAEPASSTVYALRLANGGVLAIAGTAHTQKTVVKPQYPNGYLHAGEAQIALGASESGEISSINDTYQGQLLAALTPQSAQVIDSEWGQVGSASTQR
ncbi:hypothetical protein ACIF9R_25015 [Streptomyces sp. NPDC086080]|uniref:hypothetical protein n=1 Tax=Streptomyces sp. NPDC086080 TaxID=3365748 RepID=UPI0037D96727